MTEIEQLYKDLYTPKVKMISRILRGDYASAEDVVQEAFTRAIKFYPSFDPNIGNINAWFNAILFNALRDLQKKKRGEVATINGDINPEDVISMNGLDRSAINVLVEQVVNDKHKRVLELFFIMGYTSTEISQIEKDVTRSNVTTIVNRFKEEVNK